MVHTSTYITDTTNNSNNNNNVGLCKYQIQSSDLPVSQICPELLEFVVAEFARMINLFRVHWLNIKLTADNIIIIRVMMRIFIHQMVDNNVSIIQPL